MFANSLLPLVRLLLVLYLLFLMEGLHDLPSALGRRWRDVFWVHCVRLDLSSLAHRMTDAHLELVLKRGDPSFHPLG